MSRFDVAFDWILQAEGGLSVDPHDPGGATKYGISQKSYPNIDTASITEADARDIYLRDYWGPCGCDELPRGLDLVVFDGAVLQGVSTEVRQLQSVLGVAVDGVVGRITTGAAKAAGSRVIPRVLSERVCCLSRLQTWQRYGLGWTIRVVRLAQYVAREDAAK